MGILSVPAKNRVSGRPNVFLVTDATGAIGKALAKQFASIQDSEVVLVCRNKDKAEQTVNEIVHSTQNTKA